MKIVFIVTDGKMHKISELVGEGKYVLVDFWAPSSSSHKESLLL